MGHEKQNLKGKTFGRLFVIQEDEPKKGKSCWLTECSCGVKKVIRSASLLKGETKSCGCLKAQETRARRQISAPDLMGMVFGRLTVIGAEKPLNGKTKAIVQCICGSKKTLDRSSLLTGNTSSCGCLKRDRTSSRFTKHGRSKDAGDSCVYQLWKGMRSRCNNPNHSSYHNYGGRGIRVCARWDSFECFSKDMGERPPGTSIDRINNNGNYEPGNCRWATRSEQGCNMRLYKKNKTGFKGVFKCKKKKETHKESYSAYLTLNRKRIWSKRFDSPMVACIERNKKIDELGLDPNLKNKILSGDPNE